jgi:hypothetical protein
VNKQGLECLRLLNEIICDFGKNFAIIFSQSFSIQLHIHKRVDLMTEFFYYNHFKIFLDKLLLKIKFSGIEKIKTIGSTCKYVKSFDSPTQIEITKLQCNVSY